MIVIDANLLLYAYDSTSEHHARVKSWLEDVLSSGEPVGLPWQSVLAFLRVVTNPTLPRRRASIEQAASIVNSWIGLPQVRLLSPGERHWEVLPRTIKEGQARGPLITDAHLAALAIENGGVLYTTDRDFARFPGLRWKNPLTA